MVAARLRYGFEHRNHGQVIVGRTHDNFVEQGLRSNQLGLAGKLFVWGCRKGRHLRGGNGKEVMLELGRDKVLGLDVAYIEGNRAMVSLIRVDLDMTFPSTDHAVRALRQVVDDGDLPCMPHLIVGDVGHARIRTKGEDGVEHETVHRKALIRPHLWVQLPYGSAVNAGPNGRAHPKRLLAGVARGINLTLLHLGADPAASVWLVRGKNPLSPFLWSEALNNDFWPTLSDWAEWVDTRVVPEVLSRKAAEVQSGLGKGPSNLAFTEWQKEAYRILRGLHAAGDETYVEATQPSIDSEALADLLRTHMPMSSLDRDPSWSEAAADRILGQVIGYASASWDPAKAETVRKARGAMRHVTEGLSTRKAQAEAGKRSGGLKADQALRALVEAYEDMRASGKKPTQTAVARQAGVARETASRRWSSVLESVTIGV
jgi:hypothetical protein